MSVQIYSCVYEYAFIKLRVNLYEIHELYSVRAYEFRKLTVYIRKVKLIPTCECKLSFAKTW